MVLFLQDKVDVSVFMLAYNCSKYLSEAIEGVMNQETELTVELVIGEDKSQDNTMEIIKRYLNKYPDKIRLITSRNNVGMMKNTIRTLNACRGKYIAICEGDDYWTDNKKIKKQVEFLEKNPDFSMCSHAVETIFEDVIEKNPFVPSIEIADFNEIATRGHFVPIMSVMFRREALPEIPSWFEKLWAGDIPLIHLITHYGKNYHSSEIMGVKRKHPGGITQHQERKNKKFKEKLTENKIYFYKNLNIFFNNEHKDVLYPLISQNYLHFFMNNLKNFRIWKAISCLIQSFRYSPKTFFKIFIRKILKTDL